MTAQTSLLQRWSFDELVREGLSLIPGHAPEWSNHNPSDPGITLVELLAYFTEVLVYRLSRVTPDAKLQFLRLLKGAHWTGWRSLIGAPADAIDRALDQAVADLGRCDCAVTAADFEQLAADAARAHLGPGNGVRAICVGGADPRRRQRAKSGGDSRAFVAVVLIPEHELDAGAIAELCDRVQRQLAPHCLLTTRLAVVGPVYVQLAIGFRLGLRPNVTREQALDGAAANLQRRFAAPGEPVHLSTITEVIDDTAGVDYIDELVVSGISRRADAVFDIGARIGIQIGVHATIGVDSRLGALPDLGSERLQRDAAGRLLSITLQPWEVARLHIAADSVRVAGAT